MTNPTYYTRLTDQGSAALNDAITGGGGIKLSELALGDAGGASYDPDGSESVLRNEVHRIAIASITQDVQNPAWLVIEAIIPPDVGGWWIREAGVFDEDGNMFAIAKYPETYKAQLSDGTASTLTIQIVLQITNSDAIQLVVNPLDGYATQGWVVSAYPWATGAEAKDASVEKKVVDPKRLHEVLAGPVADIAALTAGLATKSNVHHSHAYAELEDKPTTAEELGLLNVYTKTQVDRLIADLIGAAPGALDTFEEIAAAMGGNENLAADVINLVSGKLDADKISDFSLLLLALTTSSAWREKLGLGSAATRSEDFFAHAGNIDQLAENAGIGEKYLGNSQTWQSPSRSANTQYQNTTGRTIMVSIDLRHGDVEVSSNGSSFIRLFVNSQERSNVSFVVPNGHYYRLVGGTISNWRELR